MWTKELLTTLVAFAVEHSGYSPPIDPIQFEPLSVAQIQERVCGGEECDVLGFVPHAKPDTMYVVENANPESVNARAIIVHEAVHILQNDYQEPVESCADSLRREHEAYAISNRYLIEHGREPVRPPLFC